MDTATRIAPARNKPDLREAMLALGAAARAAARKIALAPDARKSSALRTAAALMRAREKEILAANAADRADALIRKMPAAFLDRLTLTPERIEAMARGVEDIAALPDPLNRVLATFTRPNGLVIERVATPLGVIGVIYESRPNVTADAAALRALSEPPRRMTALPALRQSAPASAVTFGRLS